MKEAGNSTVTPDGGDTCIAPDPLTAVLPALAALGAVASIAAINWVAEERVGSRKKSKRKVDVALRDLERSCLGLQDIFRRFHKSQKLFAGHGTAATLPMKFGAYGPRVNTFAVRIYHQSINDSASMIVLASQNSFEVMAAIEDGEINAPDEIFFGFGDAQERLNRLFAERKTMKTSVEEGLAIAVKLTDLVQKLKECRAG